MKLLLHPAIDAERFRKIQEAAGDMAAVNAQTPQEALREIADADGFIGKLTPELLAAARRLKWVQTPTASLEHYVFPELVEHPCQLTNMRGLFYDNIAEQVMGYLICFARNLHIYIRRQLESRWEPLGGEEGRVVPEYGPAWKNAIDERHRTLAGATLGVVGLGSIGSEIARRGVTFGMRVLAVDPVQSEAPEGVEAVWKTDRLGDLLAASDYVVIAAPHTPETEGLFRRPLFQQMKDSAYLVNIGRGVIVVLDDLVDALKAGEIAGAALDVFEVEPLPKDHPLWRMGNVIITPHVAGYAPRIAERHLAVLLDNVGRFARGEPLRKVVDKSKWF